MEYYESVIPFLAAEPRKRGVEQVLREALQATEDLNKINAEKKAAEQRYLELMAELSILNGAEQLKGVKGL